MNLIELFSFFSLGFFGGFGHCIAMCHPFVLYTSSRFANGQIGYWNLLKPHFFYNFGRVITYSILGFVAGIFGGIVNIAGGLIGVQKISAVVAGSFLIVYAFLTLVGKNFIGKFEDKIVGNNVMSLLKKIQPSSPFALGLVLGLLPCGLLYSALIGSASKGSIFFSIMAMILFGFGTTFAMMVAAVFGNFIMRNKIIFNFVSVIVMLAMGGFFIYSGISF
ncbi:sulfite exporter TauE/SafE family protein [Deferribacter autotrophicus]|uniref:Sulfite exporter TauE/SafE family protein n=1 Tax=Deferribacter autotrophicus TaxID=500465 RepID=A0A5A8F2N6_9BACT|nr:sulfite exporter TauE/SafE family protein [Deferribacter autotrophicus]KAA0257145.1 sulfite exporter TauE/SafE family protein [Deferribacter autotrophicus]